MKSVNTQKGNSDVHQCLSGKGVGTENRGWEFRKKNYIEKQ